MVRGLYDKSVYNNNETTIPALTHFVYTPTFNNEGVLTSVALNYGGAQATIDQIQRYIVKYRSTYREPLREVLTTFKSGIDDTTTLTPTTLTDPDFFANLFNDGDDMNERIYRASSQMFIWGVHSINGTTPALKGIPKLGIETYKL